MSRSLVAISILAAVSMMTLQLVAGAQAGARMMQQTPSSSSASRPPGEAAQAGTSQSGVSIKVDVNAVLLNVSVRDRYTNRSITGLQKSDFLVFENGTAQKVQQLLPEDAPFNLLLLLDVSGSTGSYIKLMRQAATNFTRQINEKDRIAIATFNSDIQLLQDFTSDRDAAARAIKRIHSGGGTAFYDALLTCLNEYMSNVQGRKAIVVFTDGVDNQLLGRPGDGSQATFGQLYRRIQETSALIYTIFLDSEGKFSYSNGPMRPYPRQGGGFPLPFPLPFPTPTPGPFPEPRPTRQDERAAYDTAREQLEEIVEQTGGRMYTPGKAKDLAGAYSQVADDLRVQYLVAYTSSDQTQADTWRSIRVEIKDHPSAVVRTRKGYYAVEGTPENSPTSGS
jgi:Ca-activated chloride channel family protein